MKDEGREKIKLKSGVFQDTLTLLYTYLHHHCTANVCLLVSCLLACAFINSYTLVMSDGGVIEHTQKGQIILFLWKLSKNKEFHYFCLHFLNYMVINMYDVSNLRRRRGSISPIVYGIFSPESRYLLKDNILILLPALWKDMASWYNIKRKK